MITLYGTPNTRSSRICWMLAELDIDYDFHCIRFQKGDHKSPEFLALNPAGKVPALKDGDLVLTESAAIVTYLGGKAGRYDLVPAAGTPEHGRYLQWAIFAQSELEQGLWTIAKHKFALPEDQRVPQMLAVGAWEFQRALEIFSQGLADKPYILGDTFSAADILLGHTLFWATSFKQPLEQKNIQEYLKRVSNRDAVAKFRQKEKEASSQ